MTMVKSVSPEKDEAELRLLKLSQMPISANAYYRRWDEYSLEALNAINIQWKYWQMVNSCLADPSGYNIDHAISYLQSMKEHLEKYQAALAGLERA